MKPGAMSALRHWHSVQDEHIYILSGHPTLITDAGETTLHLGMCMGFPGGDPDGHHLVNRSTEDVVYLEIGDRLPGDSGSYPDDDLKAVMGLPAGSTRRSVLCIRPSLRRAPPAPCEKYARRSSSRRWSCSSPRRSWSCSSPRPSKSSRSTDPTAQGDVEAAI
ncbi:uncharacterized protein SOCE836_093000 [Sorangium cellulosum]|uniref:Cupin type-2 domain-containing protein n=1 Tax=Sorangium cellulosum TaxID=56 RepID=A0A4P2R3B7_SORCE|nr:uncharacterized protein SOCE836_093000 [Sorangium cellulosum]